MIFISTLIFFVCNLLGMYYNVPRLSAESAIGEKVVEKHAALSALASAEEGIYNGCKNFNFNDDFIYLYSVKINFYEE